MAKGNISVDSENLFPIIKKWLYSDKDIFLRELVANAVDATQKLKAAANIGEFKGELGDLTIRISVDEKANTLTITDRGTGTQYNDGNTDLDGDGITDLWDDSGYYLFSDANNDGFDDVYANNMPAASQYNFDVAVTITTTRTALLSSEFGNILIAPCTNKIVKLRLFSENDGNIILSPIPDNESMSCLWKAQINVEIIHPNVLVDDNGCIRIAEGHFVEFDDLYDSFVGLIENSNKYSRNTNVLGKSIVIKYKSKKFKLDVDITSSCLLHGPNPSIYINSSTNVLPLMVSINGESVAVNNPSENLTEYFNTEVFNTNLLSISIYKEKPNGSSKFKEITEIER